MGSWGRGGNGFGGVFMEEWGRNEIFVVIGLIGGRGGNPVDFRGWKNCLIVVDAGLIPRWNMVAGHRDRGHLLVRGGIGGQRINILLFRTG